jgi:hypothetical protein
MTCEEANDAQFELQLDACNDVDLLKAMLRDLRKRLQGAEFAAREKANTVAAQQSQIREMSDLRRQIRGKA